MERSKDNNDKIRDCVKPVNDDLQDRAGDSVGIILDGQGNGLARITMHVLGHLKTALESPVLGHQNFDYFCIKMCTVDLHLSSRHASAFQPIPAVKYLETTCRDNTVYDLRDLESLSIVTDVAVDGSSSVLKQAPDADKPFGLAILSSIPSSHQPTSCTGNARAHPYNLFF